jgi:hypothetical protein
MLLAINISLLLLASLGSCLAIGGDTWDKEKPFPQCITRRGWTAIICLLLALALGIWKEILTDRTATKAERLQEQTAQRLTEIQSELETTRSNLNSAQKNDLQTFATDYRAKVQAAAEAAQAYENFDTPSMRRDLGLNFEPERKKRLETFVRKALALVDFIEFWRNKFAATLPLLDDEVEGLRSDIKKGGNEADMLRRFSVIQQNSESKIHRLEQELNTSPK